MRRRLVLIAAALALLVGAVPFARAGLTGVVTDCPATDWPMFGHDLGRSFASPDTCISNVNAATLAPKWFFNTGSPVTAQPAVSGGVVYVGDFAGTFHAIDASTGQEVWSFKVGDLDHEQTDYGVFPDSPAVATIGTGDHQRKVVIVGGGATVFVLDAANGTLLSHVCVDRVDPTCQGKSGHVMEIEASPVVVPLAQGGGALVLVGDDANEHDPSGPLGVIAFVLGPDGSLTPKWQFDPETFIASDGLAPLDPAQSEHACGDVWSSPSVDISRGIDHGVVVFGVGNCNHPTNPRQVESTFGISLLSGHLLWQQRPHPADNHLDLDFGATPNMLADGLVGEGGKDGVYYAYDRYTGAPVWNVKAATASSIGGFIGSTAVGQLGATHGGDPAVFATSAIPVSPNDPQGSVSNDVMHPNQAFGLHAIDAKTHQVAWDAPLTPVFGAAVYNNGVVFAPDTVSDSLVALDADTGAVLHAQPLNSPPSSPPAVSGDSIYFGSGTTESSPPLSALASFGGVWALRVAA